MQNEFILATERESFVEQVREIIEKADEMLGEDASGEPEGDQSMDGMQNQVSCSYCFHLQHKMFIIVSGLGPQICTYTNMCNLIKQTYGIFTIDHVSTSCSGTREEWSWNLKIMEMNTGGPSYPWGLCSDGGGWMQKR